MIVVEGHMEEKITLCGDNCIECPRYNAHSEQELQNVAELWYRVGWRDCVVSNEGIRCEGCSSHKQCTYHLVECTKEHNVDKCNQCAEFPCGKISSMWSVLRNIRNDVKRSVRVQSTICWKKHFLIRKTI